MGDHIAIDDLQPADVILCRGTGLLSKVIIVMDGSDYSHAALDLPSEGTNHFVGEAVNAGVVKDTLESLLAVHTLVTARRLRDAVRDMSPVLAAADRYLAEGDRYAYEQLLLLAPLCLARKIPLPWPARRLVRAILDHAAELLERLFDEGRQPMICSEFVYRCYGAADPAPHDVYEIEIDTSPGSAVVASVLGLPPPHGRGIHPDSVLAAILRAQPLMPSAELVPRTSTERAEDVGAAAREYLDAVQSHTETPPADLIVDGPLVRSARRFALALARAQRRPLAEHLEEAAPSAVQAAALRNLAQTVADFVTPGDLDRTQSLKDVGDVQSKG
jgi:hypothetical protein